VVGPPGHLLGHFDGASSDTSAIGKPWKAWISRFQNLFPRSGRCVRETHRLVEGCRVAWDSDTRFNNIDWCSSRKNRNHTPRIVLRLLYLCVGNSRPFGSLSLRATGSRRKLFHSVSLQGPAPSSKKQMVIIITRTGLGGKNDNSVGFQSFSNVFEGFSGKRGSNLPTPPSVSWPRSIGKFKICPLQLAFCSHFGSNFGQLVRQIEKQIGHGQYNEGKIVFFSRSYPENRPK